MKGISLPVEMIVIVAIAVLVLVVIAAFFTGGVVGPFGQIELTNAFNKGCDIWRSLHKCQLTPSRLTPDIDITGYKIVSNTLISSPSDSVKMFDLCVIKGLDAPKCAKACGCIV
ncbi:MAG: hypothetical protein HZA83_02750 [Thaumarchaeota archaeon]|nr:hypothetical protein [Nitrososphaerota archaeon]